MRCSKIFLLPHKKNSKYNEKEIFWPSSEPRILIWGIKKKPKYWNYQFLGEWRVYARMHAVFELMHEGDFNNLLVDLDSSMLSHLNSIHILSSHKILRSIDVIFLEKQQRIRMNLRNLIIKKLIAFLKLLVLVKGYSFF